MELRINRIEMADKNWLARIASEIAEGGEYELKLLSVVSDGIKDRKFHVALNPFGVNIEGHHQFGPYGYAIYRSPESKTPTFLDCHVTIIEDDSGIRQVTELMDLAVQTDAYQGLMKTVESIIANPYSVAASIADELFQIVLSVIKGNSDDIFMQQDFTCTKRLGEFDKPFSLENEKLKADFTFV